MRVTPQRAAKRQNACPCAFAPAPPSVPYCRAHEKVTSFSGLTLPYALFRNLTKADGGARTIPTGVSQQGREQTQDDPGAAVFSLRTDEQDAHVRSKPATPDDTFTVEPDEAPKAGLAPSLEGKRIQVFLAMIVIDLVILLGTFALVSFVYLINFRGQFGTESAMLSAYLLLPIFLTIGLFNGSYSGSALVSWRDASWRAAQALVIAAVLLNFVAFFAKMNAEFSRVAFSVSAVVAIAVMTIFRVFLVRRLRSTWGVSPLNRLVIQAGGDPVSLPGGFAVDADRAGLKPTLDDPAALDRLARYLRNMDQVFVSCPETERNAWSQVLKGAGIHAEVVSPFAREIGALGIRDYREQGFATLVVSTGKMRLRDRALKRLFDVGVSVVAMALLSPLLILIALAIKLEDGGPVFFRQRRVGRGNHFFTILKFRSMSVAKADLDGAQSASRDDARITRIGALIRRTSLDELPQLYSVLRGHMSIVGPRPHALGSQAGNKLFWQIDRRYWLRHTLRPGITGLAQVRGHRGATDHESDLEKRLQSDLEYLRDWSLWRDIAIIVKTLRVLRHDKAY